MFEEIWEEINDSVEAAEDSLTGTHDAQVQRWLATLIPPGLPRSSRLKADLEYISPKMEAFVVDRVGGTATDAR